MNHKSAKKQKYIYGINNGFKDFPSVMKNARPVNFKEVVRFDTFSDGQKVEDMPNVCSEDSYWKRLYKLNNFDDVSQERADAIINKKIRKIKSYFKRLERFELKEKEILKPKPSSYLGVYLPFPKEIQVSFKQ